MKCKLCQSDKVKIIRDTLRYNIKRNVLQCQKCDFVFLEPLKGRDKKYYEGQEYRKHYGPKLNKNIKAEDFFNLYLPFQKIIAAEIAPVLKPHHKILDIGCSTGHFLHSLKGKAKIRVGLELNKEQVSFINKKLDFKVYSEPLENLFMKEAPFDIITCLQVLEHINEPINFLQAIKKNLKPGGYLYLELPNIDDALISVYQNENYKSFYFHEPHLSYFSVKTLKNLLAKAGFIGKIKTIQRYNIMNHFNWLLTGRPQESFIEGNSVPRLIKPHKVKNNIYKDLNNFIKLIDLKYKNLLARHNFGENLSFLGQKI